MAFWMERWQAESLAIYVDLLTHRRATRNGVFGAKMLYGQLQHFEDLARQDPALADLPLATILDNLFPNLHYIWATRDDKLRQAISWFKARQTGVWGQSEGREEVKLGRAWRLGDEPLQAGELAFDFAGIAELLAQAEAEDAAIGAYFAENGIEPYRIVYEEFSPRYEDSVADILRWLGLDIPARLSLVKPRTLKLADDRTEEWIARFRELHSVAGQR
jgi:LPS sulfotransferase NodH